MTEAEKLQKELDELNAKRRTVIEANTVSDPGPNLSREYTYRKSTVIKPADLLT